MASIQEAMSNSTRLLEAAEKGTIAPDKLAIEVESLLANNLSARGFMAALATGELPRDPKIQSALLKGISAGKANSYELIVKNIVMSGCSAIEHEKNGRKKEAEGSRATSASSIELARLLADPDLDALAKEAHNAIQAKTSGQSENNSAPQSDIWFKFFERWGYSNESLQLVADSLRSAFPVISVLILGLGIATTLAFCALPAQAERDHKALLLAGKYYLINHPDDARTLASVGSLEIEFGSYDDAIKHLSRAIELEPKQKAHYIDRADAYLHLGAYDKAIADANVLMTSTNGTELGLALANRGEAYYRLKNYKQALEDLSKAIHYLPDLGSTYFYRAKIYEQMKQTELATADYARARQRGFTTDGQQEMSSK